MALHHHARDWYCRRKHWQHQAGSGSEPFPLPHVKKVREREDSAVRLQCAPVAAMDRGVSPATYCKALYKQRHKVENMFAKLKDWRRISTRYDRCAHTFFSAICIAATVIFWLNQ